MARLKLAVLVSGRGSNLQALLDACVAPDFPAAVELVISNRPGAPALARAEQAGVPTLVIRHGDFPTREAFDEAIGAALEAHGTELVCLAGFMRLLSRGFVDQWRDRIVNVHPSLLPAFKGLQTHMRVLSAGVRITGATVHFVRAELDEGPIIAQGAVAVCADDTPETLADRVLALEHRLYPLAVRLIAEGRARVAAERTPYIDLGAPPPPLFSPAIG